MAAESAAITAAVEGWQALYAYGAEGSSVVLGRPIAAWVCDPSGSKTGLGTIVGVVIDDLGVLQLAHEVDGFICYCDPEEKAEDMIKRRAAADK